jgi:hypothetical protein
VLLFIIVLFVEEKRGEEDVFPSKAVHKNSNGFGEMIE